MWAGFAKLSGVDEKGAWRTVSKDPSPDVRRLQLYKDSRDLFATFPPGTHIFCEEPISMKSGKTNRVLALAAGAVWAAHVEFDLWWHWVDISSWKLEVLGRGNADKDDIREFVEYTTGIEYEDQDWCDAFCIDAHGAVLLDKLGLV